MTRAMRHWLGLAVLCCAPAMGGEWIQEGADSFVNGLFTGTEIDSLGRVSLGFLSRGQSRLGCSGVLWAEHLERSPQRYRRRYRHGVAL